MKILTQGAATLRSIGPFDWTNPIDALDVNADGFIAPSDVLLVINEVNNPKFSLNTRLNSASMGFPSAPAQFFDASPDGFVVALDVLVIINHINSQGTTVVAEGQSVPIHVDLAFADAADNTVALRVAQDNSSESAPDDSAWFTAEHVPSQDVTYRDAPSGNHSFGNDSEDDELIAAMDAFFADFEYLGP